MMKTLTIILLTAISMTVAGQNFKMITQDEIPGLTMVHSDTFTQQNLRKYPGSRIDLWSEYGLKNIYVTDYQINGGNVRIEVYPLEDALSAYGLYSVSISECAQWNRYSFFSCANPNKISFALGSYYINVINTGNSSEGQSVCEELTKKIIAKNPQEPWNLPAVFQVSKLIPYVRTLQYTKGSVGMSIAIPQMKQYTDDLSFSCFSIKILTSTSMGVLTRFQFPDFNNMDRFMMNTGLSMSGGTAPALSSIGTYRSFYKIDDTKIIFLESNSPDLKLTDLLPQQPSGNW